MKKNWIWIVVILIIVIAGAGYAGRHKLKSMMGMAPTQAVMQAQPTTAPTSSAAVAAPTNNIYLTKTDPTKGAYLTDFQGMTLYTFDKDTTGVSTCYDKCAAAWPFYTSGATAQGTFPTNITVLTRKDGGKQFAWKGMPLYYFASDKKAGDLTGDGVAQLWHIVKP